jgi:hypothetical protein
MEVHASSRRLPRTPIRSLTRTGPAGPAQSGRSSGVEHNLAKVGVEGSNPFARSIFANVHTEDMGDGLFRRHR